MFVRFTHTVGVVLDHSSSLLYNIPLGDCTRIDPFYYLGVFWFPPDTNIAMNILGCPLVNTGMHFCGSHDREWHCWAVRYEYVQLIPKSCMNLPSRQQEMRVLAALHACHLFSLSYRSIQVGM